MSDRTLQDVQKDVNECTLELQEARITVKELECKHERLIMEGMKLQAEIPDEVTVPKSAIQGFPRRKRGNTRQRK